MQHESSLPSPTSAELVGRKFRQAFGASVPLGYRDWLEARRGAALGFRRASEMSLFLELYLDEPIECLASRAFSQTISRQSIVEIGNFAADNAIAMVELWGKAANDLGAKSDVAVATLTAPLRKMFARIGVPIIEISPATPDRLGSAASDWGSYYTLDPFVCAGRIADGQQAISRFLARRSRSAAA